MSTGIISGNVRSITIMQKAVDLASVATAITAEQTITLEGVKTGDNVFVSKSDLDAGLVFGSARVSAADTVKLQVANVTAGAINAASETLTFLVVRPESTDNYPTEVLS